MTRVKIVRRILYINSYVIRKQIKLYTLNNTFLALSVHFLVEINKILFVINQL